MLTRSKSLFRRSYFLVAASLIGLEALHAGETQGQVIRARVVDSDTRQAIADATVVALGSDTTVIRASASSGDDGFFRITLPGAGTWRIRVTMIGYGPAEQTVTVTDGETMVPAFVMPREVVQLDPVEARAKAARPAGTDVGFRRASMVVSGARLHTLERQNVSIYSAIRELSGGLRQRPIIIRGVRYICIESTRRIIGMRPHDDERCGMVVVVVDGVPIGDPMGFLRHANLSEYESVEYLSPVEAGAQYGLEASEKGALVLWTRGRGPHRSAERNGGG